MKTPEDFQPWMDKKKTNVVYQGTSDFLDLTGITAYPSLNRISVCDAKRVLLPAKHDWSGVRILDFSWERHWAKALQQKSATAILIYRPTQDTLDCFNYEMPANQEGISSLSLSTIKHGVIDRWFPESFSVSWLSIVNSRNIDLSSAGPYDSIGLLDLRYVTRLKGLAHFTQQGKVGAIRLDNPLIMDPAEFWNIQAECINFGTDRKENDVWLAEVWKQRPKNWEEKYFISSKFINKELGRTNWEDTWNLDLTADERAIAYRFRSAMKR